MSGGGFTFSQVPTADIPRSVFDRSHCHKTTFDSGYLVPIFVDEALPGDTFSVSASVFARLSTPIVPIMDNMRMDLFFFFVPNRLLWDNWQRFMGEQDNPGDNTDFSTPYVDGGVAGFASGSLFDYFGLPVGKPNCLPVAFHSRAYNLIWNEWFRDENLQDRVVVDKDDGPDDPLDYVLLKRGKRHDYFTSCLPFAQKGPGVMLPLGDVAPVINNQGAPYYGGDGKVVMHAATGNPATVTADSSAGSYRMYLAGGQTVAGSQVTWPTGTGVGGTGLIADLSMATGATINSLRQAFQIQRLLERDARGGTRYTELLRSHFGVVSPDSRLQRPEFLGGGIVGININPVVQTSGSGTYTGTPQGNLAAVGTAGGHVGFSKSFVEHGVIIGLAMVRADLSYQQGMHKMFTRRTRYDFYWPAFAHLGEQAVLNGEIYFQGNSNDELVFGYQERWAEYRYFPSKITGKFRSTDPQSLDVWHLAQDFTALPVLGSTFIAEDPPISRVVAVNTEPQFLFDSHFKIRCTRPMPTYSVPGLIDHF